MNAGTYAAFEGAEPYFSLVRAALDGLVDGVHFFDIVTEETSYEVRYDLGWPRVIRGRAALMAAFLGYVEAIRIDDALMLAINRADGGAVVIIEYDVRGTIIASGARYANRFCSVIELRNRKIAGWRDYMDSHAAWSALVAQA